MKIAISGFGRIGRTFLRTVLQDPVASEKLEVAAINIGPASPESIALLFKYDSVMGTFPANVTCDNGFLMVNNTRIAIIAECDPKLILWKQHHVEWVVEASGCFTTGPLASMHFQGGAKKILITAPAKDEDVTIIPGVNDTDYDANKHRIVAMGSCTTNAIIPIIKVIKEKFTLLHGLMGTTHAYTNNQVLLDVEHPDPRRARAAAINIIPTSTGASSVITKLFPDLAGKIHASALRVPVAKVSLIDFTFTTQEPLRVEDINAAFKEAAEGKLKGIIHYATDPLVSSDYSGHPASCIIDSLLTQCSGNLGKVFGWYDNEWGYSERLKDFLLHNS